MKTCLLLAILALLTASCAEVPDLDESRPRSAYSGPMSGPMSGDLSPRTPGSPGALDALSNAPDNGTQGEYPDGSVGPR